MVNFLQQNGNTSFTTRKIFDIVKSYLKKYLETGGQIEQKNTDFLDFKFVQSMFEYNARRLSMKILCFTLDTALKIEMFLPEGRIVHRSGLNSEKEKIKNLK